MQSRRIRISNNYKLNEKLLCNLMIVCHAGWFVSIPMRSSNTIPFRVSIMSLFDIVKYVSSPSNVCRVTRHFTGAVTLSRGTIAFQNMRRTVRGKCSPFAPRVLSLQKKKISSRYLEPATARLRQIYRIRLCKRTRVIGDATSRGLCRRFIPQRAYVY